MFLGIPEGVKKVRRHLSRGGLLVVMETQLPHFTPFCRKCEGCYSSGYPYSGLFWEWWTWTVACVGGTGRENWCNNFLSPNGYVLYRFWNGVCQNMACFGLFALVLGKVSFSVYTLSLYNHRSEQSRSLSFLGASYQCCSSCTFVHGWFPLFKTGLKCMSREVNYFHQTRPRLQNFFVLKIIIWLPTQNCPGAYWISKLQKSSNFLGVSKI